VGAVIGAVLGLVAAVGAGLAVGGVPWRRRVMLSDRLEPYLRGPLERAPGWRVRAGGLLDRVLGGGASVRRRLAVLGDGRSVPDVRVEQVGWGALGLAAGGSAGAALVAAGWAPGLALVTGLAGGIAGVAARDVALSRAVARRRAAVLAEFPVVAELLALAVTAGEGPVAALDRVTRLTGGSLAADLDGVLARVRAGIPLAAALAELRDRCGVPVLARFADGMGIALEHGTPLAEVLRTQAADVREAGRRALIEDGGRREIAMLAPVVFGILPTTVLFALYPGLAAVAAVTGG
jgi:tight adherence protein C